MPRFDFFNETELSSETTKYTYDRKSILLSGTKASALEAQELSANCYAPNIKNHFFFKVLYYERKLLQYTRCGILFLKQKVLYKVSIIVKPSHCKYIIRKETSQCNNPFNRKS